MYMLNTNTVSIDELRSNLADIISRVTYGQDRIVVKKYNRKAAILISVDEYEKLLDPRKRFSSKEDWDKLFKLTDSVRNRMPIKDQKKLEKIINEEVVAVRYEK